MTHDDALPEDPPRRQVAGRPSRGNDGVDDRIRKAVGPPRPRPSRQQEWPPHGHGGAVVWPRRPIASRLDSATGRRSCSAPRLHMSWGRRAVRGGEGSLRWEERGERNGGE
jgi:hypothetical protein